MLTFSQAQGYEDVPGPLKLGELPPKARTHIWNVFYMFINKPIIGDWGPRVDNVWGSILHSKHVFHDNLPLDEWDDSFEFHKGLLRHLIETLPFNELFDLIQFVMRHSRCPREFINEMKRTFAFCDLAYTIDMTKPPTIIPAVTEIEGNTIVESLQLLRRAGLEGSASHLRKASEYINGNDWAGSIRESINAVESVARQLDPKSSETLRGALASLEKRQALHPALKEAFTKLLRVHVERTRHTSCPRGPVQR